MLLGLLKSLGGWILLGSVDLIFHLQPRLSDTKGDSLVLHTGPSSASFFCCECPWGPSTGAATGGGTHGSGCCPVGLFSATVGSFCPRDGGGRELGCAGHLLQASQPCRLLMSSLLSLQIGFFKREQYPEATVPQYHAVKIPREDRQQFKEEKTGTILRNNWGSPLREGSDAHPILAADGHPQLGSDEHPAPGTA